MLAAGGDSRSNTWFSLSVGWSVVGLLARLSSGLQFGGSIVPVQVHMHISTRLVGFVRQYYIGIGLVSRAY